MSKVSSTVGSKITLVENISTLTYTKRHHRTGKFRFGYYDRLYVRFFNPSSIEGSGKSLGLLLPALHHLLNMLCRKR
jgi:hypothetical protein